MGLRPCTPNSSHIIMPITEQVNQSQTHLVQVAIKSHLLHICVIAKLHEGLAGGVAAVEDLLEDVQHL